MCGNQIVDPGELCDGNCPASCDDSDPCTTDMSTGSAAACNLACTNTIITAPTPGDSCCPEGANATTDTDCSASCGNGVKEGTEKCDGADCPTSCDDNDPCTMDVVVGKAAQCTAECTHKPITAPAGGDGCCPKGANANNDDDCKATCGNNVKEDGETCDGSDCRMNCDDGKPCTRDFTTGSPGSCDVRCDHDEITPCCGNGRTEGNETCDGANCRMTCAAKDKCHTSRTVGSPDRCDVRCDEKEIVPCCGNGRTDGNEKCDGNDCARLSCNDNNACTTDSFKPGTSAAQCNLDCDHKPIGTGRENLCGGCGDLGDVVPGRECTPGSSSFLECAIAGEWVCSADKQFATCRNKVASALDNDSGRHCVDDNCNGTRDEGETIPGEPCTN